MSVGDRRYDVIIYTDGANVWDKDRFYNTGGWGFVMLLNKCTVEIRRAGYIRNTTSQRMELTAVINALKEVRRRLGKLRGLKIIVRSDSTYAVKGASIWMYRWCRNKWKKSGKVLANKDLWLEIYDLVNSISFKPKFEWVRGHAGNKYNELCDKMAYTAIKLRSSYEYGIRYAKGNMYE